MTRKKTKIGKEPAFVQSGLQVEPAPEVGHYKNGTEKGPGLTKRGRQPRAKKKEPAEARRQTKWPVLESRRDFSLRPEGRTVVNVKPDEFGRWLFHIVDEGGETDPAGVEGGVESGDGGEYSYEERGGLRSGPGEQKNHERNDDDGKERQQNKAEKQRGGGAAFPEGGKKGG